MRRVQALVDYEGLVLIETAFGETLYCSLTGTTVKRQGTSPAPRLAGTLTFAQVDCDLATESCVVADVTDLGCWRPRARRPSSWSVPRRLPVPPWVTCTWSPGR